MMNIPEPLIYQANMSNNEHTHVAVMSEKHVMHKVRILSSVH